MSFYKIMKDFSEMYWHQGVDLLQNVFFRKQDFEWSAIRTDGYQAVSLNMKFYGCEIDEDLVLFYVPRDFSPTTNPRQIKRNGESIDLVFDTHTVSIEQKNSVLRLIEKINDTKVLTVDELKPLQKVDPMLLSNIGILRSNTVTCYVRDKNIIFTDGYGNVFSLMTMERG